MDALMPLGDRLQDFGYSAQSADTATGPLICFSHLRWDFVLQRPQHLMQRFSKQRRVFFFEEYIPTDHNLAYLEFHPFQGTSVIAVRPRIPHGWDDAARQTALAGLLDTLLAIHAHGKPVLWFYTPMMYGFARHVDASAVVYDCMDELANFSFAPPGLQRLERDLIDRADVVFTGGHSLYEAKRHTHFNIHPFPSSVDVAHFAKARLPTVQPVDQAVIAGPLLGFYGVIDERIDLGLIEHLAKARPNYQIVMIGPVVKIDRARLPQAKNIHYLGGRDYSQLPSYLSGWDAALMPFGINEATRFISPTKTLEYLAGGTPVVSTAIKDVERHYSDLDAVIIAQSPAEFIAACDFAIALGKSKDTDWLVEVDTMLASHSWDRTFGAMADLVDDAIEHAESAAKPKTANLAMVGS